MAVNRIIDIVQHVIHLVNEKSRLSHHSSSSSHNSIPLSSFASPSPIVSYVSPCQLDDNDSFNAIVLIFYHLFQQPQNIPQLKQFLIVPKCRLIEDKLNLDSINYISFIHDSFLMKRFPLFAALECHWGDLFNNSFWAGSSGESKWNWLVSFLYEYIYNA